jgi:hypothetical protein
MQLSEILTELIHYLRVYHRIAHIGRAERVSETFLLSLNEDPSQMKRSYN